MIPGDQHPHFTEENWPLVRVFKRQTRTWISDTIAAQSARILSSLVGKFDRPPPVAQRGSPGLGGAHPGRCVQGRAASLPPPCPPALLSVLWLLHCTWGRPQAPSQSPAGLSCHHILKMKTNKTPKTVVYILHAFSKLMPLTQNALQYNRIIHKTIIREK